MKKYVIAKTRKDLKNNLKFLKKKYYKKRKKERSSWSLRKKIVYLLNRMKEDFLSLRLSETYLICDVGLYKLFVSEIELYYANNDFDIEVLYYIKNYKKKMYDRKFNVILPLIISILASVIWARFINTFLNSFIETFVSIGKNSWKIFEELLLQKIEFEETIPTVVLMLEAWFLIFLILVPLIWISRKVINVLAAFCLGINSEEDMAYRYEMDYVEKLLENESELIKCIKEQAENLVVPISIIVSNVMTKEEVDYIDFYNKEVQRNVSEGLLTNPNIKKFLRESMKEVYC